MPITPDHAGRAYPPTVPYEVTRSRIVEFAAALGDDAPAQAALPAAPPTFGAVVSEPAWNALFTDPELELSRARIVQAEQQFRYLRALEPGDVVTATLTIEKVRVRGATEFIYTSVDIRDEVGERVLDADAVFVHTRGETA